MNTLVVYDSLYGNTRMIAEAIASAIAGDVTLRPAGEVNASTLGEYDLLVAGAPTHGGRASEPFQEMLAQVPAGALGGVDVAAFDTRLTWWWIRPFGFAAPKIARSLEKKGGNLVAPAEGFLVTGGEGPLKEGEVERAAAWAGEVAAQVGGARSGSPVNQEA